MSAPARGITYRTEHLDLPDKTFGRCDPISPCPNASTTTSARDSDVTGTKHSSNPVRLIHAEATRT